MSFRLEDGKRYETLYEQLEHQKEWPVRQLMTGGPYHDWHELLVRLFKDLCRFRDDEAASRCFDWILKAQENWLLYDFLEQKQFATRTRTAWVFRRPQTEEGLAKLKEVEQRLERLPCLAARELWPLLPQKGRGHVRIQDTENESHLEECDAPAMLKTKEKLLKAIAERWRTTKDQAEADELFRLLLDYRPAFADEYKQLEAVVRDATRTGFSPGRLAKYYLMAADQPPCGWGETVVDRIARILAIAWIRNTQPKEMAKLMAVVAPLQKDRYDPNFPAYDLLAESAELLADLEERLVSLRQLLGSSRHLHGRSFRIRYLSPEAIRLVNDMTADHVSHSGLDENRLHDQFGELRDLVQQWRQENSGIAVIVRLEVRSRYAREEDEPLFAREQLLNFPAG